MPPLGSLDLAGMIAEIRHNLPHVYKDDTAEVRRSRAWGLVHGAHLMLRQAAEEMRSADALDREEAPE